jgi:hypothetical protein
MPTSIRVKLLFKIQISKQLKKFALTSKVIHTGQILRRGIQVALIVLIQKQSQQFPKNQLSQAALS